MGSRHNNEGLDVQHEVVSPVSLQYPHPVNGLLTPARSSGCLGPEEEE